MWAWQICHVLAPSEALWFNKMRISSSFFWSFYSAQCHSVSAVPLNLKNITNSTQGNWHNECNSHNKQTNATDITWQSEPTSQGVLVTKQRMMIYFNIYRSGRHQWCLFYTQDSNRPSALTCPHNPGKRPVNDDINDNDDDNADWWWWQLWWPCKLMMMTLVTMMITWQVARWWQGDKRQARSASMQMIHSFSTDTRPENLMLWQRYDGSDKSWWQWQFWWQSWHLDMAWCWWLWQKIETGIISCHYILL